MEPLKEMFNLIYYKKLVKVASSIHSGIKPRELLNQLTLGLEDRSLNERLSHTSQVLGRFLPANFRSAVLILDKIIPAMDPGYTALVFPDFIARFGLGHFEVAMDALKRYTVYGSSEFAVRHFLKHDFEKTIQRMKAWALDNNLHVRRLASEGSRPRLPWSKEPRNTTPILESLRADPELYVKKSVANHLNDISKDHPDYMLSLVGQWDRNNHHTAWIVKHASRSLIKKGHGPALLLFEVTEATQVHVSPIKLSARTLSIGETLHFQFKLKSDSDKDQKLIIDYLVDYRKKKGGLSPKVFKLKEIILAAGKEILINKTQSMKDYTTRKHYHGRHRLHIQVNGKIMASTNFNLTGV
jgi:3-methyladenine DNA glycosylase AlkC